MPKPTSAVEAATLLPSADHPQPKRGKCSGSGTAAGLIFEACLHGVVVLKILPARWLAPANFWLTAVVAVVGFAANVVYASAASGRFLKWPMALSAVPFVLPGMAMWASGFPSVGMSIASIVWTSPPTDALRPFTHFDRNEFAYAFDMAVVAANFIGCVVAGAHYVRCAFDNLTVVQAIGYIVLCVFLWGAPLVVWSRNRTAEERNQQLPNPMPNAWEKGHIIWHVVASGTCFLGSLSGIYVCNLDAT